ncbi:MAG: hypothetical protein ACKVP5_17040 [Aestuariivirga sp.]
MTAYRIAAQLPICLAESIKDRHLVTAEEFRLELQRQLGQAQAKGLPSVDIKSGDLHRTVGVYPDAKRHRMPVCCDVMYDEQRSGDQIISKPPKGKGATLVIRYKLPR